MTPSILERSSKPDDRIEEDYQESPNDVQDGELVYIDVRPYRPMIGRVDSKMPGFFMVHIGIGSRYRKGRTLPVPEHFLQNHKVHRLQVQAVTGPLPELFGGANQFPLFTDKPDKYPDLSHPKNRIEFDQPQDSPEQSQLSQARNALGISQNSDPYARSKQFLMGGSSIHKMPPERSQGHQSQFTSRKKGQGSLGY